MASIKVRTHNCSDLNRCRSEKPRVHKDSGLFYPKKQVEIK